MAARPGLGTPVDLIATHGYGDSAAVWSPLLAALAGLTRAPVEAQVWDLPGAAHEPHRTHAADVAGAIARFLERN